MGRIVQCCYCKQKEDNDNKDIIIQLPNKKYSHIKCHENAKREKRELDELVEKIKEIHNISTVPPRFYPFLQDLRNGTNRCQRSTIKKSKQGYRYKIITRTYEFYEKDIIKNIKYKGIEDINSKLMYSYAVVVNKIDKIRDKLKKEYLQKKLQEQKVQVATDEEIKMTICVEKNKKATYDWL